MGNVRALGAFVGVATFLATALAWEIDAKACGGCVQPAPPPAVTEAESVITDEQMIFSISQDQTTLYDEIEYSGSPSDFAWILPIKGTVTVGLSADILFQTINGLTATSVTSPPTGCPPPPTCGGSGTGCLGGASSNSAAFGDNGGPADGKGAVTVTSQKQVGPYETVQLHSNDGSALNTWLATHKYVVPAADAPVIAAYVADHFDFLALRLAPGEGVHAMQPVRVTSKGASISLPLHMVAVGTGAKTGITIWVVADSRWEPQNFPTFTISDSQIAWDWATSSSNYEALRLSTEETFKGRGWQVESSLELSQSLIGQALLSNIQNDVNDVGGYATFSDAGDSDASTGEGEAGDATSREDAASGEAGGDDAGGGDAGVDGVALGDARVGDEDDAHSTDGAGEVASGGDSGVYDPYDSGYFSLSEPASEDLAVLFAGIKGQNARITRMRSDVAHAALSVDMVLEASKDQSELTNQHIAQIQIGQPLCPVYDGNCTQTGEVPRDQALASTNGGCNAMPSRSASRTTFAALLGIAAFAALRVRRRQR